MILARALAVCLAGWRLQLPLQDFAFRRTSAATVPASCEYLEPSESGTAIERAYLNLYWAVGHSSGPCHGISSAIPQSQQNNGSVPTRSVIPHGI